MMSRFVVCVGIAFGLAGCGQGGTWVDTSSGDCLESQIEETRQQPQLFAPVGQKACAEAKAGDFAGEFRCTGSTEDGTRKLQAKCEG